MMDKKIFVPTFERSIAASGKLNNLSEFFWRLPTGRVESSSYEFSIARVSVCNRTFSLKPDRRHYLSPTNGDNAFAGLGNFPLGAPMAGANLKTPSQKDPFCLNKERSSRRFLSVRNIAPLHHCPRKRFPFTGLTVPTGEKVVSCIIVNCIIVRHAADSISKKPVVFFSRHFRTKRKA